MKNYTIAVAGTGYVGLSIATLLSQHHKVYSGRLYQEYPGKDGQQEYHLQPGVFA